MTLSDRKKLAETLVDTILNLESVNQQSTVRYRRTFCGLTLKEWLQLAGSFLLPLLLAVFTVVITFTQKQEASIQRLEDRVLAREQREQDLNISNVQRETDKMLAEEKRVADDLNAARQRNMSLEQRLHELKIEEQRYDKQQEQRLEDDKLAANQRSQDLQMLEDKRNADNLNAKEQRDNDRVIADAKQLADDLRGEKERNVSREIEEYRYEQTKSRDLDSLLLSHINDLGILLENHNGSLTTNPTIAALARAKTLHIIRSIGTERSTRLLQFLFDANQLTHGPQQNSLDLSSARLDRIDMSVNNDLISMKNVSFVGVHMNQATFVGQDLSFWNFTGALLDQANFSRANCTGAVFDKSTMIQSDFSYAIMNGVSLRNTNLINASFAYSVGEKCSFKNAKLLNSTFYQARMGFSNFYTADLTGANLEEFYLSGSTLAFASLINSRMDGIYVLFANLSHANMLGAVCSENKCYLHNALSLLNAILPNGTNGTSEYRPTPLVQNGYARCEKGAKNDEILLGWNISGHPLYTTRDYHSNQTCVFTPNIAGSTMIATMNQRVNISMYDRLVTNGHALISVKVHLGETVKIAMREIDRSGKTSPVSLEIPYPHPRQTLSWENRLSQTTVQVDIDLIFSVSRVWPTAWVEYVELAILLWLP